VITLRRILDAALKLGGDLSKNFSRKSVLTIGLFASAAVQAQTVTEQPLVLTSLAPVYQLTLPLVADTNIDLQLLPESPRSMQTHTTLFVRQAERYADLFRRADAVLTIGKVWAADPFYISARQFNIRVVNIDASKPWSHELDGVAVTNSPATGQVSPWFWLSPSNVVRMLDIIAGDLQQLYPAEADTIKHNLDTAKAGWVARKSATEQRLLEVDDPQIYALTDEFVYLTSDLGLFVAGYFVKQDIDWTEADYTSLTEALQAGGVRVVIHKWEPTEAIQAAITAAGATLVVLDTLETTTDFAGGFDQNLEALLNALKAP
jgi:ABC-type Zn uptake system ZnuABC Zn-binding protein ZnuA